MTNLEVQTLTGVIQQAHRRVYSAASAGQRDEAYQRNLRLLSEAVARGAELMSVARREVSGSPARIGERPPREVALATWREFVRQFVSARTTWFNETGSGVAAAPRGLGGSSMVMDAGYFRREATRLSQLHSPVYAAVSRGQAPAADAVAALLAARNGVRHQVNLHMAAIGANERTIAANPPRSLETATWQGLLGTINAVGRTLNTAATLRGGTQAPATRQPATQQTAAIPQKPGPATETPARPRRSSPRRAAATGGGGGADIEIDLPSPREAIAAITEVGGEALDTARGTFSAIRTVGTLLTGAPADLLGGGITTPLRVIDRLQAIATVLNPPSVAIYQRPWFWPTILGVGGYLGYSYYKSTQAKKPAASPAAKKKAVETAPTLPAAR